MLVTSSRSGPRPGGRAARVQAAVHAAVKALQAEMPTSDLTVPLVAARAGVTPSTIYRRWGDLSALLADVAVELLRPDGDPPDTGTLLGDLAAWSELYLEEMSSEIGQAMVRDVLGGSTPPSADDPASCRCHAFTESQLETILERARQRGERDLPTADALMDDLIAPILYRLLFAPRPPTLEWLRARLPTLLRGPGQSAFQRKP
ncbi:MAG: TetR/AcrR family transcriptional regulator C-terminal ligand-binding domain-containing protein [Mitsuaria chitosanitabida]|uniref:TetR/AcrR family transcriptional regulator n=1 Tax=Roseateles chitosanitabidus TaxID=65048 RepID=UPI001B29DEAC|nr:TetR/AcrR family transcriptional regulator [Roseateles chitosanitabidus]MBO9687615.1 TetR/AcrR family transcriptional regulator C-terminal ligand-binding domain-containing protein [Roseateles chitosanitabidus]